MHDLKVTGGTIVDGTGRDRCTGDVAIRDGRIVEVGEGVSGAARHTIEADGRLLTPGFVDIHTHYDGQVTWDEVLEPSSVHGVTSMVMGNCGVGFAPVQPGKEEWLIQLKSIAGRDAAPRVGDQEADLRYREPLRTRRSGRPATRNAGGPERDRSRRAHALLAPNGARPSGGRPPSAPADGYDFTVVNGEITRENGADTGARPGRLIRGAR